MSRPSKRKRNELRPLKIELNVNRYAEGSCIINCGNTRVLCMASIDERVPRFLKNTGRGWVTAEYNMLPRATHERKPREITQGKPNSRNTEIKRLIGRSLRAGIDMQLLGERQIIIDCDVLQADGGTRCASITGGFVALYMAIQGLMKDRKIRNNPVKKFVGAVSCGMYNGMSVLDLDYDEDSTCDSDINFVMDDEGKIIEIQGTAEGDSFSFGLIEEMYDLAQNGIKKLITEQKRILKIED